jgi:hypothetical protein
MLLSKGRLMGTISNMRSFRTPFNRGTQVSAPTRPRLQQPRLILHLGTHKTGTTALQFFLRQQWQSLRHQGFLYPQIGTNDLAHLSLAKAVGTLHQQQDGQPLQDHLEQLKQQIITSATPTVVISSEHFFSMPLAWTETLIRGLETLAASITAVMYVRPQRELWRAIYNQKAKALKVLPTHAAWGTTDYLSPVRIRNMFYADYLDQFSRLIGRNNVVVRPYRRSLFFNGDIVHDFCGLLGCPDLPAGHIAEEPINPSLGWKGVAFSLWLAARYYQHDDSRLVAQAMRQGFTRGMRAGLVDWIGRAPNYLDANEQRRLDDYYTPTNARPPDFFSTETAHQEHRSWREIPPDEFRLMTRFVSEGLANHHLAGRIHQGA